MRVENYNMDVHQQSFPADIDHAANTDNALHDPGNLGVLLNAINAAPPPIANGHPDSPHAEHLPHLHHHLPIPQHIQPHLNPQLHPHLANDPARMPGPPNSMSIQHLLAGGSAPDAAHQNGDWNDQAALNQNKGKRKLDPQDEHDPRAKIRRTVQEHLAMDHARVMSMTTVVCLHAAVAQKSYGSEKRFLCPPPIVRIEGPSHLLNSQYLSMCIVSEDGVRSPSQKAPLDGNMQAAFKHLHVAGTAKQKNFHLALDIAAPLPEPTLDPHDPPSRTWASFESAPVTIISKPSKKTAKTRNISSCILPGGPVSLFNRINSQTVRTKYMTIEAGALCASNISWSAFNVNVISRPPEPPSNITGPQPVSYGSQIILTDALSGISTGALIIRKVDKGRVSLEDGGPVSQMQKIALQRVAADGSRQYLSAAGPLSPTGALVAPPAPGTASQAGSHTLMFQSPRTHDEVKDGVRTLYDQVDDYLCWTIVGISKFQYTFFDATGKNTTAPILPLTPFPTLFNAPVYRQNMNVLELTVSNFYSPSASGKLQPLEVWLGSIGPLNQRVFPATLPGPLTSVTSFSQGPPIHSPVNGERSSGSPPDPNVPISPTSPQDDREGQSPTTPSPTSLSRNGGALGPLHSIVILDMPEIDLIVKALQDTMSAAPPVVTPVDKREAGGDGEVSEDEVLQSLGESAEKQNAGSSAAAPAASGTPGAVPPASAVSGRSLPLLFIRPADGIGYHSGRSIVCENIMQNLTINALGNGAGGNVDAGWIAAAQVAASSENNYAAAWNLRVV